MYVCIVRHVHAYGFFTHITLRCQCHGSPYVFKWLEPSCILFVKVSSGNNSGIFWKLVVPMWWIGLQMGRDLVLDIINVVHSKLWVGTFKVKYKRLGGLALAVDTYLPIWITMFFSHLRRGTNSTFKQRMLCMVIIVNCLNFRSNWDE